MLEIDYFILSLGQGKKQWLEGKQPCPLKVSLLCVGLFQTLHAPDSSLPSNSEMGPSVPCTGTYHQS